MASPRVSGAAGGSAGGSAGLGFETGLLGAGLAFTGLLGAAAFDGLGFFGFFCLTGSWARSLYLLPETVKTIMFALS